MEIAQRQLSSPWNGDSVDTQVLPNIYNLSLPKNCDLQCPSNNHSAWKRKSTVAKLRLLDFSHDKE